MPFLSIHDLHQEEANGNLIITPDRLDFSEFSLDLRVNRLFKEDINNSQSIRGDTSISDSEFLEDYCDEIELTDTGTELNPGHYLWLPVEKIELNGLIGQITSKSSYARLAARAEQLNGSWPQISLYQEHFICQLTLMSNLRLRKAESIAQIFVNDGNEIYSLDPILAEMVESNILKIERKGERLGCPDLTFDGGVCLTMGQTIYVYQGGLLEKGKNNQKCFQRVELSDEPYYLPPKTFFISASEEEVFIQDGYIGHVQEAGFLAYTGFSTHANAPYIGPETVFCGNITFENFTFNPVWLTLGIFQSKLNIFPLRNQCGTGKESRYKNQKGATLSKAANMKP